MTQLGRRASPRRVFPHRLRFRTQLVLLLLVFGLVPLVVSVSVGFVVGRDVLLEQARTALQALGRREADLIGTEIQRQRLLLRTIAGQVAARFQEADAEELRAFLHTSLPDEGVFDGLRLVGPDGNPVVSVQLRAAAPLWPSAPVSVESWMTVHRDGTDVVAYLLSEPVVQDGMSWWLQGHVPEQDFARQFGFGADLLGTIERGIFDASGARIMVAHPHTTEALRSVVQAVGIDSLYVFELDVDGSPAIVLAATVPGLDWRFAAAMPIEEALAPVTRLRDIALVGSLLLAIVLVITAHSVAVYVTRPLQELAVAADEFGRTGSYRPIQHRGIAETDALVSSFAQMTQALSASRAEIDALHARELERAQQLATVGELASGIAHEIRNPLTGVLGAVELASNRIPSDDEVQPLLEESLLQLRRIEDATTRLLQYARPPTLRVVTVDGNSLVERAVTIIEPAATAVHAALQFHPDVTGTKLDVDPELLVQVIVNLGLNAIDAVGEGGVVSLTVRVSDARLEIIVCDNGPGIAPDKRKQVFRPFFTDKHRGTGLGLPISEGIVTRHGGRLTLEDTPGGGATFVISLPIGPEGTHDHD